MSTTYLIRAHTSADPQIGELLFKQASRGDLTCHTYTDVSNRRTWTFVTERAYPVTPEDVLRDLRIALHPYQDRISVVCVFDLDSARTEEWDPSNG